LASTTSKRWRRSPSTSFGSAKRQTAALTWRLDRAKLCEAWRREGRYLLRTNREAAQV
jgi:hypothetical protein